MLIKRHKLYVNKNNPTCEAYVMHVGREKVFCSIYMNGEYESETTIYVDLFSEQFELPVKQKIKFEVGKKYSYLNDEKTVGYDYEILCIGEYEVFIKSLYSDRNEWLVSKSDLEGNSTLIEE